MLNLICEECQADCSRTEPCCMCVGGMWIPGFAAAIKCALVVLTVFPIPLVSSVAAAAAAAAREREL